MARGFSVLLILAVAVVGQAITPSSYFTSGDIERLRSLFAGVQPYGTDVESIYYSILGFSLLDEPLHKPQDACNAVKNNVNSKEVDSLFFASQTVSILKRVGKVTCTINQGDAKSVLTNAAQSVDSSAETIYRAVAALSKLQIRMDSVKISEALEEVIKRDDSPISHGFAFLAASYLTGDISRFHDLIEDIIAQADEVDEKYFQFDGGLYATAVIIDGAYKLSSTAKLKPTISDDKALKFANYFLSRKHAQQLKSAAAILSVTKTLTDNQYHIPIAVSLASQVSVTAQSPTIQVRVSNMLGGSLGDLTVTADTARHVGDDAVVMSKTPLTVSKADSSLYELNFMKVKPAHGFYTIIINVAPAKADKRLIGTQGAEVAVKVTTRVTVENVEIGVADRDQTQAAKTTKLQHPNKAANVLNADHQQKVLMKFQLRESAGEVMTAHQAFVRLSNAATQQEIIFVAEPDASSTYKFDLDVGANAKDFGHLSGRYTLDLIVGDSVIENPLFWTMADIELDFPEGATEKPSTADRYLAKPEIHHVFREPEVRPPTVISNLFTALVLAPLLILVIMWMRLGVNLSNMPLSVSAFGFHFGLAAIFGLYYMYWVQLDMFVTLRYLGFIGIPTFLFGNSLLSGIAAARK